VQFVQKVPIPAVLKDFERHILLSLINSTVKDVSIREDIGYDTIMGIIDNNIRPQINWEEIKALGVIGIDEVSIKKGHKDFVTVISAYIDGKLTVLAVLKGREKSTVKAKPSDKGVASELGGLCHLDAWTETSLARRRRHHGWKYTISSTLTRPYANPNRIAGVCLSAPTST
jgi:hypothetical protein